MNILDAIPGIGSILDKVITSPKELEELKIRMAEIDVREVEARLGVQREWLGNKSFFVAGAIPMMLWMVSVVVLFNHVAAPLLSPLTGPLPTLDLPEWYSGLAGTVIIGLFGKKAWDGNTIRAGGFVKPAKGTKESEEARHDAGERESKGVAEAPVPEKAGEKTKTAGKAPAPKGKGAAAAARRAPDTLDTPEVVNERFNEIVREYEDKRR